MWNTTQQWKEPATNLQYRWTSLAYYCMWEVRLRSRYTVWIYFKIQKQRVYKLTFWGAQNILYLKLGDGSMDMYICTHKAICVRLWSYMWVMPQFFVFFERMLYWVDQYCSQQLFNSAGTFTVLFRMKFTSAYLRNERQKHLAIISQCLLIVSLMGY